MCLSHHQTAVLKIPEDARNLVVLEHAIVRITVAGNAVHCPIPLENVCMALMQNGDGSLDGGPPNTSVNTKFIYIKYQRKNKQNDKITTNKHIYNIIMIFK